MSSIFTRQQVLIEEFERLSQWEERYKRIIELGKSLPPMPELQRTEQNKVKGCQSQVWMTAHLNEQNEMILEGDSDALLVKGLVGLLVRVYSGAPPEEILKSPPEFLKTLGFEQNLSPSRANGLHSMLKQIKMYATAFQFMLNSKN